MTAHKDLLNLYKQQTGTTIYEPKPLPTVQNYQEARVKEYSFRDAI